MKKKSLLLSAIGLSLLVLSSPPPTSATLARFIQVVKEDDADTRFHLSELEAFEVGVVPNEDGAEFDGKATSSNDIGDGELITYGDGELFPDVGTTEALEHGGGAKDPNNELESGGSVWSTANGLGENAQYTLDLGAEYDVTTVRMWPRADTCCSTRWMNLVINLYGDDGGKPGTLNATQMHTDDEGNLALELTFLASVDTDEDGMPDGYETAHGLNPEVDDAEGDLDGDTITNFDEFANGTLPEEKDTDGDGLDDNVENGSGTWASATMTGTDPLDPDSDGDGIADGIETNTGVFVEANKATDTGTDPNKNDTDGDNFRDGVEVAQGSDPTDEASVPESKLPVPLVYFDFEGDTAALISDKSGNNRNGDVSGDVELGEGAPQGSTPGQGGQFSFNGAGFLDVSGFDWFELIHDYGGDYTLSCWLKPDAVSLSGDRFIWGQTAQGVHNGVRGSGTLHTAHWGSDFNANTPLTEDEWVQAVWTYDGELAEANIYLNGELDGGPFAQNAPNGSGSLIIGGRNGGTENFVGSLDDLAIWHEVLREDQIALLASGTSPIGATQDDSDGDGMTDSYEEMNELNPAVNDANEDKDGDGLTNLEEFTKFLKANNPDSDGDTLNDKVESDTGVWVSAADTGTNPRSADTDRDGLPDGVETNTKLFVSATDRGTDPHKPDTDGDLFEDGREVSLGTDPLDANSKPAIPPLGPDLIGMDLTDPEDDGDPEDDIGYNAVFASSEEEGFGGGESAFNVFDNVLGGGNAKWCCGDGGGFPDEPIWIQATFEDPIVLSMFSIASANDTVGRDPLIWEIQGSNDGENFETIFRQEDDIPVWEARDQVAVFTAGTNYSLPGAYTTIRFTCFETGLTGGARFQISELEFFGSVGSVGPFQITGVNRVSRDGSEFLQITWPSTANGTYAIETGLNLQDDWTEVEDGFESQGDSTMYELELAAPAPAELYIRVRAEN